MTTMQPVHSTTSERLIALSRTLQTLREQEDVDVLVQTTLDYLQAEFDYPLIWLGLYDRLKHCLQGRGGTIPDSADRRLIQQIHLSPGDIMEQAVIQQAVVRLADLREESRAGDWQHFARQASIQGAMVFPICHHQLCFGVVVLGSPLWGASPSVEDRSRLSMLFGELAMGLYQADLESQRRQTKRPHEPLLSMMSQLQEVRSLDDRLNIIVSTTQQFLSPDRTHVYWYDRDRALFWLRSGDRRSTTRRPSGQTTETTQIPLAEFSGFHKMLADNRLIAIGEAYSSLKADATSRLMLQIQARSLLAAPILSQGNLLGFLSVEGTQARIWQEEEKQYLQGAAQLVALATPLSELQERMAQIELDRDLTMGLTQTSPTANTAANSLDSYAQRLGDRLQAEAVLVLAADANTNQIEVVCEYPATKRWSPGTLFPPLSFVDWQLLQHSPEAIALQIDSTLDDATTANGGGDMRLTAWQPLFLETGLRSPLIANTHPGRIPEGFLVVAGGEGRAWTAPERELVSLVGRQIGVMLRQRNLQQQAQSHQQVVAGLHSGWQHLAQSQPWEDRERQLLKELSEILRSPFVGLVTWEPGLKTGVLSTTVAREAYAVEGRPEINVKKDRLLQKTIARGGILGPVASDRLPASSQQWLGALPGLSIRTIALKALDNCKPTGAIVVADRRDRTWEEFETQALELFAGQLAWARRAILVEKRFQYHRYRLEPLVWYKQHRLEDLYRDIAADVKQLTQLSAAPNGDLTSGSLQAVREQELLRELSENLTAAGSLLKHEQWRLRMREEPISIVRLFARVLDRVEPAAEKRQIWMQVHRENNATLYADPAKLELVFAEVLLSACRRSPVGGRIDIWYRPVVVENEADPEFLELSVTDSGELDARLLAAFQPAVLGSGDRDNRDFLTVSPLDRLPGLEFAIFERILRQMGGDFLIERIEDGRLVSRLLVPLQPQSI